MKPTQSSTTQVRQELRAIPTVLPSITALSSKSSLGLRIPLLLIIRDWLNGASIKALSRQHLRSPNSIIGILRAFSRAALNPAVPLSHPTDSAQIVYQAILAIPIRRRGKPGHDPSTHEKIIQALRGSRSVAAAATRSGVPKRTIYTLIARHPKIEAAYKTIKSPPPPGTL